MVNEDKLGKYMKFFVVDKAYYPSTDFYVAEMHEE